MPSLQGSAYFCWSSAGVILLASPRSVLSSSANAATSGSSAPTSPCTVPGSTGAAFLPAPPPDSAGLSAVETPRTRRRKLSNPHAHRFHAGSPATDQSVLELVFTKQHGTGWHRSSPWPGGASHVPAPSPCSVIPCPAALWETWPGRCCNAPRWPHWPCRCSVAPRNTSARMRALRAPRTAPRAPAAQAMPEAYATLTRHHPTPEPRRSGLQSRHRRSMGRARRTKTAPIRRTASPSILEGRRSCEGGSLGAFCNDAAQCEASRCALPADSFVGRCSDGREGTPCYAAGDCDGGLVCADNSDDYPGFCTTPGSPRAPCKTDADCRAGRCVAVASDVTLCSQGGVGEPCDDVGDCATAHCVAQACSTGMPGSPCTGDSDCTASYCGEVDQVGLPQTHVCAAGVRGDPCQSDAQCQQGFCVAAAGAWGSCEMGEVGQRCIDAGDCRSGACTAPGADGVSQCTNGTMQAPCASDGDCASGICVTLKPGEGTCSDGANGAQCVDTTDCKASACVLQPGGGLPGTCGGTAPGKDLGGGCSACSQSLAPACGGDRPVLWLCDGPLTDGGLPAALGTDCTDLATDLPRFCCPLGLNATCPPG